MNPAIFLRRVFCLSAFAAGCLVSRGAPPPPPPPPPPVMVWFYMLNAQEKNLNAVLKGEDGTYPFALNGFLLEGPALVKRGQPIVLEAPPLPSPSAGGATPAVGTPLPPLLEFTPAPDLDNLLVLFATNGAGTIVYHQVVDQSEKAIPPGNILVINLTRARAAIAVGESQTFVGAQARALLPVRASKPGTHSQLVKLAMQVEGEWQPVYQQMLPQKSTARRVALLVPDGRGGVVPTMLPFLSPDTKPPSGATLAKSK